MSHFPPGGFARREGFIAPNLNFFFFRSERNEPAPGEKKSKISTNEVPDMTPTRRTRDVRREGLASAHSFSKKRERH